MDQADYYPMLLALGPRVLTLQQVKAHDVKAIDTSKALYSRDSLEQLLSACHWKSHNPFTQFYLKDVGWADSELFLFGPSAGFSADPPVAHLSEEICIYVYTICFCI